MKRDVALLLGFISALFVIIASAIFFLPRFWFFLFDLGVFG
jgi:hypothetical protein